MDTTEDQHLYRLARETYVHFQGSISSQDMIDLLQNADWSHLIDAVIREDQIRRSTYENESVICESCGNYLRRQDRFHGRIPFRIPLAAMHICCIPCAETILKDWQMICTLCGDKYYKQANNTAHSLCESCATSKLIRESRRIMIQMNRTSDLQNRNAITLPQWIKTLDHFSWRCAYCNDSFVCIDHFVPVSLGGKTTYNNCVPSCKSCNSAKHDTHPDNVIVIPVASIDRVRAYLTCAEINDFQDAAADHLGLDIAV